MSDCGYTGDYEVGYGKPPLSAKWPKGVSGNPSGRPKRSPEFSAKVLRELNSKLTITENGKQRVITKDDGLAKQTVNKALAGNLPAMRLVIELRRQEHEKRAEEERLSPINLVGIDPKNLTTEELFIAIQPKIEASIKARLEKSIRAELEQSIRLEVEQSMRAEVSGEKQLNGPKSPKKRDAKNG